MAKWEIIEDNKFKKQTGGKTAATRAVTTKNSKNNPKMLSEVTVVEPKTVTKNKPVVQNPNVPVQDATRINQPYYEKKVITNPNVVSYKSIQKPNLAPYYVPAQDASKVNTFVNDKQIINNQPTPTPLINLSNANSYNIPNLTGSDSLYYGSPYKNGEILNQEIWNKNKAIENKKGAALYKNVKKGIDIGQTIADGLEVFPPTSAIGFAINAGLTVPSVAMNYHDKNYAGMIPDAVGLVPGNILPPGVDLGKSVGEIGYNGYNIYQDFKQTGGAAATRAIAPKKTVAKAATNAAYATILNAADDKKDLIINSLQNVASDAYYSFWNKYNKSNETNVYANDTNKIKLNTGRFTGANVPSTLIDDLASAANRNNIPVGQMLALAGRESTFGQDKRKKGYTHSDKAEYVSGWNVANQYEPYSLYRFLADKKVPGISTFKNTHGWSFLPKDEEKIITYTKAHPELIDEYKSKIAKTLDVGDKNAYDLAAIQLKNKGVQSYNPNDPNYVKMFQKDYDSLKQDKNLMNYLQKKGYDYENVKPQESSQPVVLSTQKPGQSIALPPQLKHGGIIEDPMGQWAHPGSVTKIPSNQITMQGVNYPVLGISDRGHTQMMYPGKDYSFRGKSVTEYPMMAGGGEVNFTYAGENHRVYEKESPTGNGKGIEGHIMVNHPTENKKRWDTIDLTKITNGKVKTVAQGVASTKKWHKENPEYANGGQVSSWEIIEDTPKFPNGGNTNIPIYVNNPNDPRLQMYSDSLYNSNLTKNISPVGYNLQKTDLVSSTPIKPTSVGTAIYPNNVHGNMKPSHWDNYVTGVGFDKNSPEYSVARFTPPTQPYILKLQDHAQEQINMPTMGNINSSQQISQPIINIPTVIPPKKDYVTIKTGSSYRNPETGAFEQESFKIDKVTGKRILDNGGKISNWQIIEY